MVFSSKRWKYSRKEQRLKQKYILNHLNHLNHFAYRMSEVLGECTWGTWQFNPREDEGGLERWVYFIGY